MENPTAYDDPTYLVPRFDWNKDKQCWDAYIEERTNDKEDDVVFAWMVRECATPFEALEAVTTEYVRMASNGINYYLSQKDSEG